MRMNRNAPTLSLVKSVAVLPFLNEGGDSTQEYLTAGMGDGLATALGKIRGIRVISRTLAYRYRGLRDINAQNVGKELDAGYVVHATVRRLGDKLRVSAQVLNASDNSEFWSEDYERDARQAYAIQDDLAGDVAIALQGKAAAGGNLASLRSVTSSGTSDPEAYDLYLRGRYLLERRGPGVAQAIKNFEQAIAKDSMFARAHAALGVALELLPYFSDVDARAVGVRAIPAAKRALALDTTLAEAHTALGIAYSHEWQWDQSLAEHRHAVALNPEDASARLQYGRVLVYTGHVSEAKTQFERARMLDPYSAVNSGWLGHLLSLTGHVDEGITELNRAMQLDSVNPPALFFASLENMVAGDSAKALILAERLWNRVPQWRSPAAMLLARLGHKERALELLKTAKHGRVRPEDYKSGNASGLHLAIGDTAAALTDLERSAELHTNFPTSSSLSERAFDPLRRSARFAAIVRRVGLDERIFTSPTGGRPR
jgi:TolB-like protein/Tfp pilus assembly protein PilF